jgi:peptidoglycan-N-acetylglucosamine deacetylase
LRAWWPGTVWATKGTNVVHLTFDDGPDPEATPWILELLNDRSVTATFFVVGEKALKHPDLIDALAHGGHSLGAHTMKHEHGWHTPTEAYVESAQRSLEALGPGAGHRGKPMFRPPYGKVTRTQARRLAPRTAMVMWDVLSGDYAARGEEGAAAVLARLKRNTRPGSIVVFHDSAKCSNVLKEVLPAYLDWLDGQGWKGRKLEGLGI